MPTSHYVFPKAEGCIHLGYPLEIRQGLADRFRYPTGCKITPGKIFSGGAAATLKPFLFFVIDYVWALKKIKILNMENGVSSIRKDSLQGEWRWKVLDGVRMICCREKLIYCYTPAYDCASKIYRLWWRRKIHICHRKSF